MYSALHILQGEFPDVQIDSKSEFHGCDFRNAPVFASFLVTVVVPTVMDRSYLLLSFLQGKFSFLFVFCSLSQM